LSRTSENVDPGVAQVAICIVEQFGGAVLTESFHIGADVVKLRALFVWIDVVAVFHVSAVERNVWEDRWWARCCFGTSRWVVSTAVEDVQPKVAQFSAGVVEEISWAHLGETFVVSAEVKLVTALLLWIRVNAISAVGAVHGGGCCSNIGNLGGGGQLGRWSCSSAGEGVGWDVAGLGLLVEYQTFGTLQFASLLSVATVEFVGAVDRIVAIDAIRAVEVDMWQCDWRWVRRSFAFVDVNTGAGEDEVLVVALVGFRVVNETMWTTEFDRDATDADVEQIAAVGLDGTNWIWVVAVGLVGAVDHRSSSCERFVAGGFGRC
jgi:hypothetical protein